MTPPRPENARMQKTRRLPMPGPGILITVPLGLLPEYLALYGLAPLARGEAVDAAKRRGRDDLVLFVKRTRG